MNMGLPRPDTESMVHNACWRSIGVLGDASCEELTQAIHCRNCAVFTAAGQQLLEREASAADVAQQTALVAGGVEETSVGSEALLIFRIAEEWLALEVNAIVEVAATRPVHRVPHRRNRALSGIANFRGELHLCVSLRALLKIDPSTGSSPSADGTVPAGESSARMIVCQRAGQCWAFAADEVVGVHRIRIEHLANAPSTIARCAHRLVNAVFSWEDKSVGRLDAHRLFDSMEQCTG